MNPLCAILSLCKEREQDASVSLPKFHANHFSRLQRDNMTQSGTERFNKTAVRPPKKLRKLVKLFYLKRILVA
jgi:hypothetical protein